MPFFKACHGAGVRASPRRLETPPDEVEATLTPRQTCRIRVVLKGFVTKNVTYEVVQGQRWCDLEVALKREIIRNNVWQRVLLSEPDALIRWEQKKLHIKFYRCEYRAVETSTAAQNYPLTDKDKDSIVWFIDLLEKPQLLIEAVDPTSYRTAVADKNFYRTYRYTEPRTHFFVAYEGFGTFSDSLISYQYDQTGIEKKVSTVHPQIDESDEDLLVVLDFCRCSARVDLNQEQRIHNLSRLLKRLLDSMESTKQIPPGLIEIRKCRAGDDDSSTIAIEIWVNQLWPVAICVVSAGNDGCPVDLENQLLRCAHEWGTELFEKHRHYLGARRVPYFGIAQNGAYLQFVGMLYVPKRELGLYRFTDYLCLIHQTDDLLERERQLLMSLQSFFMSCVELGRHHDKQPKLESQAALDQAYRLAQYPCHIKFKYNGTICDLNYGNPPKSSDHISNHAGSMTQIYAATSPQMPGKELVIKFCARYGDDAHNFLARRGWAPRLYAIQNIPGRLKMVVMERSPGQPLSLLIYNFLEKHPTATLEMVQEAFSPYLRQMREVIIRLHKRGLVHGDVRSPNIIIDDTEAKLIQLRPISRATSNNWRPSAAFSPRSDSTRYSSSSTSVEDIAFGARAHLIDFDWAGPVGKAMYPTLLNRKTNFPRDAHRAGYIKTSHDMEMLENICQMPYTLWRSRKAEQTTKKAGGTTRKPP